MSAAPAYPPAIEESLLEWADYVERRRDRKTLRVVGFGLASVVLTAMGFGLVLKVTSLEDPSLMTLAQGLLGAFVLVAAAAASAFVGLRQAS